MNLIARTATGTFNVTRVVQYRNDVVVIQTDEKKRKYHHAKSNIRYVKLESLFVVS